MTGPLTLQSLRVRRDGSDLVALDLTVPPGTVLTMAGCPGVPVAPGWACWRGG